MKIQCCFCKHICCNHEYDEMLDCEIALEESGKSKCYQSVVKPFYLFELEDKEEVCKSYLKAFNEEYGLCERIKNNKPYMHMRTDNLYSQDAIDYANNRVNYEMNYTYGMDFTDKQKEWIKEHIYFSTRKAYQKGFDEGVKEND